MQLFIIFRYDFNNFIIIAIFTLLTFLLLYFFFHCNADDNDFEKMKKIERARSAHNGNKDASDDHGKVF